MAIEYTFSWQKDDAYKLDQSFSHKLLFIFSSSLDSNKNIVYKYIEKLQNKKGNKLYSITANNLGICSPLLPFLESLSTELEYGRRFSLNRLSGHILKDITRSETVPFLVNALQIGQQHELCGYLNEQYNNVLVQIEKSSRRRQAVLIFTGYPQFDLDSKNLIKLILSKKLDLYYPQLSQAQCIFLCEEGCFDDYQELYQFDHIDIHTSEPHIDDMKELISYFSLQRTISETEYSNIYELCGGQLSKIDLLAQYLSLHNAIDFKVNSYPEVMYTILASRLKHMGKYGDQIQTVLSTAAEIGKTIPEYLLKYAMKAYALDLDYLISCCNKEYLTERIREQIVFRHEIVWQFFQNKAYMQKEEINIMLSAAVKHFNPSNYFARGIYLEQATHMDDAGQMYCFALYSLLENAFKIPDILYDKVKAYADNKGIQDFISAIYMYYESIATSNYTFAKKVLEEEKTILPVALTIMRDYMIGLASYKIASTSEDIDEAIIIIEKVMDKANEINENAFWAECASSLISLYVNTYGYGSNAHSLSKDLVYYYCERMEYDTQAKIGLHVLYRKWSALFSVEIAVKKTELSVNFFMNTLYHSQYLMALNNHGANLIILGLYQSAIDFLERALRFCETFPQVVIQKSYLLNNYYLAQLYAGEQTAHMLKISYKALVDQMEDNATKIIPLINMSICFALDDSENGLQLASDYLSEARSLNSDLADDYYTYYTNVNNAAVQYLLGNRDKALSDLELCKEPPMLMKSTEKVYLKKRYHLWHNVFKGDNVIPQTEFNTYMKSQIPSTGPWDFIGRAFLGSDIQFWSES